jgi:hypothetical protein
VGLGFEGFRSLRVCLGFFLWVSLVVPVYTPSVLKDAYAFFNKTFRTYKK